MEMGLPGLSLLTVCNSTEAREYEFAGLNATGAVIALPFMYDNGPFSLASVSLR